MNLKLKSDLELQCMINVFLIKSRKIDKYRKQLKHNLTKEQHCDSYSISLKNRINAIKSFYDRELNSANVELRARDGAEIKRFKIPNEKIINKFSYLGLKKEHAHLPDYLSGNMMIAELPMAMLESAFYNHRRLSVFRIKGFKCANSKCGRVGTKLIKGVDPCGNFHVDIYTKDYILMTVDHIHPKAKGGGEEIENKQPMCTYCNSRKSDKIVTYEYTGSISS